MIEINIDGLHLRVDRDRAVDLLEDMTRVNWSNVNSSSITDRLYNALFHALKAPAPPRKAPRTWNHNAKWKRLRAGSYILTVSGVTLARVVAGNAGWWLATVYLDGEGTSGVDPRERFRRIEERSLGDAQASARHAYQTEWDQLPH